MIKHRIETIKKLIDKENKIGYKGGGKIGRYFDQKKFLYIYHKIITIEEVFKLQDQRHNGGIPTYLAAYYYNSGYIQRGSNKFVYNILDILGKELGELEELLGELDKERNCDTMLT